MKAVMRVLTKVNELGSFEDSDDDSKGRDGGFNEGVTLAMAKGKELGLKVGFNEGRILGTNKK